MEARGESSLRVLLDRTEVTPTGAGSGCVLARIGRAPPCTGDSLRDRKGEPRPSGDDDNVGFSGSSSSVPFLPVFWGPGVMREIPEGLSMSSSASEALELLLGCGRQPPM